MIQEYILKRFPAVEDLSTGEICGKCCFSDMAKGTHCLLYTARTAEGGFDCGFDDVFALAHTLTGARVIAEELVEYYKDKNQ